MRDLKYTLTILLFATTIGHATPAAAQQFGGNLSVDLNSKTLVAQSKAEQLFERGDYRRARIIYLNDLAPFGDKYAQYMLGFLSFNGLGVEQDPAIAAAWYRLAAERGGPKEFVKIRDEVLGSLDVAEKKRSDKVYIGLRGEYSDIAISMRQASREFEDLSQVTTGSRLGRTSSAVTVLKPRDGSSVSSDVIIRNIRERMQAHLDNVTAELGIARIDAATVTDSDLVSLEEQVWEYVGRVDTH